MNSSFKPGGVKLLPVIRGKGSFGRVVEGMYEGRRVAVKLLTCWEMIYEWDGGRANGPQEQQNVDGGWCSDAMVVEFATKTFLQEVQVRPLRLRLFICVRGNPDVRAWWGGPMLLLATNVSMCVAHALDVYSLKPWPLLPCTIHIHA